MTRDFQEKRRSSARALNYMAMRKEIPLPVPEMAGVSELVRKIRISAVIILPGVKTRRSIALTLAMAALPPGLAASVARSAS